MTEEKIRDSIARDIWQDEQECDNALRRAKIGSDEHTYLNGRLVGLRRARDIVEGVLVRELDTDKLADVVCTVLGHQNGGEECDIDRKIVYALLNELFNKE